MTQTFIHRRRALQKLLEDSHLDALVVAYPADRYYLTGFTGDSGAVVVGLRGTTLITDSRFSIQAGKEAQGVKVEMQKGSLWNSVGSHLKTKTKSRIGFDPEQVSVAMLGQLKEASGTRQEWKAAPGLVSALRMVKEPGELSVMRKAAILAGEVVIHAARLLKPGVREFEIAAEIEYFMRKRGATGPAFETIAAFGERSALPHARPTAKRLRKNELVVLDLGAILQHYCSDITRTFYLGRAPARVRRWYKAVQEAQAAAVAAVESGVTCGQVDGAARKVLAGYRLDRYFVHSTGHGLGLEVHENPRVARGQQKRLVPGNVITIEPGVYVEGAGGIRIEDDVVVHANRTEVLTRIPRDLIEL